MSESPTRERILDAARVLFAERGFTATTIRHVAEEAGVSPALVIKLTGSKADLFRLTAPEASDLEGLGGRAGEPLGERLVRAIVERRDADDYEYWATVPFLLREAHDPTAAQAEFRETALRRMAHLIGDTSDESERARLVVTLLLGLATSLRTADLMPSTVISSRQLIETYGAIVQSVIDGESP